MRLLLISVLATGCATIVPTQVTLSAFQIQKTEVTVAEYRQCVNAGVCNTGGIFEGCNYTVNGRDDHPMNCVDWNQAKKYCEANGARLPTEAEWEFAARGTDNRKYPWGNEEPNASRGQINTSDTAAVGTHPDGASPFGVQDMAGNVREWVADGDASYPGGSVTNPPPKPGERKVLRGGCWEWSADRSHNTYDRFDWRPETNDRVNGFRCARDVPAAK